MTKQLTTQLEKDLRDFALDTRESLPGFTIVTNKPGAQYHRVVYDGDTASHYVDGELVKTEKLPALRGSKSKRSKVAP